MLSHGGWNALFIHPCREIFAFFLNAFYYWSFTYSAGSNFNSSSVIVI